MAAHRFISGFSITTYTHAKIVVIFKNINDFYNLQQQKKRSSHLSFRQRWLSVLGIYLTPASIPCMLKNPSSEELPSLFIKSNKNNSPFKQQISEYNGVVVH